MYFFPPYFREIFKMTPDDVVFMASPLTFDPSVIELFLSLTSGACLLVLPTVIKMVPQQLSRALFQQHRVTVLQVRNLQLNTALFGELIKLSACLIGLSKEKSSQGHLYCRLAHGFRMQSIGILKNWVDIRNTLSPNQSSFNFHQKYFSAVSTTRIYIFLGNFFRFGILLEN